ncbi:MAG: hypothetical protein CSA33_09405 [Desulfobulbus propionicus]|nr:MAG: hypothetical protein CSA33_09405 [Desulfobulbus propionicus]
MVAMVTGKKSNSGVFLRFFFVLVLLVATAFLLQQTGEVRPVAIRKSLASFPHTIGAWQLAKTFQSSSDVVELLGVDDYIQYNYISPSNEMINLYAGYYRAVVRSCSTGFRTGGGLLLQNIGRSFILCGMLFLWGGGMVLLSVLSCLPGMEILPPPKIRQSDLPNLL